MATKKKIPTAASKGAFDAENWNKIGRKFSMLKGVAQTPYNAPLGTRTSFDDLFIGARVALDARLKDEHFDRHNPFTLAKAKNGRMAVAVQQAQYMMVADGDNT